VKILFDGRFLTGQKNGISNDSISIFNAFGELGHELYVIEYRGVKLSTQLDKFRYTKIRTKFSYRVELVKSLLNLTIDCSKYELDLYIQFQISPIRLVLKPKTKRILRVHDIFPLTNPTWFRHRSRYIFNKGLKGINKFDSLLANSQATSVAIKNHIRNLSPRVIVLPCYVPPVIDSVPCGLCSFCLSPPTLEGSIFAVGTFEPRKNYGALIEAYLSITSRDIPTLIIVGSIGWKMRKFADLRAGGIFFYTDVCDGAIHCLYSKTSAFVSVSLDEGFNIPLSQALTMGLPIVASNLPVHREFVGGPRVIFVEPLSPKQIANAIQKTINMARSGENPKLSRNFPKEIDTALRKLKLIN
jgi:glycosyltransferase involved in cell wall biosynthesis